MTNEEKAEEYAIKITDELRNKGFLSNEEINQRYAGIVQGVLYGLAEGRKEGYEQGKNNERESQCGKKNYEKDISRLEKENAKLKEQVESLANTNIKAQNIIAELKKQNESLKDTLQAIATDTNEHITHNVAQNELDEWEKLAE